VSVTIVAQGYLQPGQGVALVDEAVRQIEQRRDRDRRPRGAARVFQQLENPAALLLVADRDGSGAFTASSEEADRKPLFDTLCTGIVARYAFRRLSTYDTACRPPVFECAMVLTPTTARAVVQALIEQVLGPAVNALPGFVARYSYQDLDNPNRFLTVQGWDSPADLDRFLQDLAPRLTASLHGFGAQVDRFVGCRRVEAHRPAVMSSRSLTYPDA
jgi:hypothetical protein